MTFRKRLTSTLVSLLLMALLIPGSACAGELIVFAASSLRQPFEELAHLYQQRYPEDQTILHFAGSQMLRTQLEQGAPVDVIASANMAVIAPLLKQGLIDQPHLFARNRLALLADRRSKNLQTFADLANPGLLLAVGNPQVPIGIYTQNFLQSLAANPAYGLQLIQQIEKNIVSQELSVKAIVTKVLLGEIDGAFVYRSELSERVLATSRNIKLPEAHNQVALYPVAINRQTSVRNSAERFISLLLSDEGQQLLQKYRFLPITKSINVDNS